MAVLASSTVMVGSIVFTAIKLDEPVKDWLRLIPGQGGFLDQLDSMIFATAVFYQDNSFCLGIRPSWQMSIRSGRFIDP